MTFGTRSALSGSNGRQAFDPRLESPAHLALVSVLVWLIGALIHPLAVLAPLGLLLLALAGVAYLLRPRTTTMYWRGRRIDLEAPRNPIQRLYGLFFRR